MANRAYRPKRKTGATGRCGAGTPAITSQPVGSVLGAGSSLAGGGAPAAGLPVGVPASSGPAGAAIEGAGGMAGVGPPPTAAPPSGFGVGEPASGMAGAAGSLAAT